MDKSTLYEIITSIINKKNNDYNKDFIKIKNCSEENIIIRNILYNNVKACNIILKIYNIDYIFKFYDIKDKIVSNYNFILFLENEKTIIKTDL
jgi:hypothetical protein